MKKIMYLCFSAVSGFCVLYYSMKFYTEQSLFFGEELISWWMFVSFCILVSIIIGLYNMKTLKFLKSQNKELKNLILSLEKQLNKNHFSQLDEIQNSNDISLDILEKVSEV